MKKLILILPLALVSCGSSEVLYQNCTVTKQTNKSTISCPDGTVTEILDGSPGSPGTNGVNGTNGANGATGPQGPAASPLPTPSPEPIVQSLIDNENIYRESQGQTALTNGLSCTVQSITSGAWLSSGSPGYNAGQGVVVLAGTSYSYLFQSSFNVPSTPSGPNPLLPQAIQPLFVGNNYRLSCVGQIVITDTSYYEFDLNSDDGSILTIDGVQVVNNDGSHGMTLKNGTKLLRQGVHTFNLLYGQTAGGSFGLILTSNGHLVTGDVWYH